MKLLGGLIVGAKIIWNKHRVSAEVRVLEPYQKYASLFIVSPRCDVLC